MKNIKDKIFAILAAAVILIGAGAGAGAGILPIPDSSDIPGIEESKLPPKGSSGNDAPDTGIDPNCDFEEDNQIDE